MILLLASLIPLYSIQKGGFIQKLTNQSLQKKNFQIIGTITSNIDQKSYSANFVLNLCGNDSLSAQLFGPLGLEYGKFFSNRKIFVMFNKMNNIVYKGTPDESSMNRITGMNVNIDDIMNLLICRLPYTSDAYSFVQHNDEESTSLFKYIKDSSHVDFVVVSDIDSTIKQYQRKSADGKIELHLFFKDYKKIDNNRYASTIIVQLPDKKGTFTINFDKFTQVDTITDPMNFAIPKGVKVITIEGE
jgi:outer membrane biogenesis lipoprotein LolB